ncbi:HNH endonuclease family protein [Streptomyces olivaceiscleroticus]|uniref:HNH endonuclease family protein n=1 Tax=Streptomyces olivaceiscleroticus TaxID=68245 RepID=A0ABP3K3K9_9ACTN
MIRSAFPVRRAALPAAALAATLALAGCNPSGGGTQGDGRGSPDVPSATGEPGSALATVGTLTVKGRAPKTGYDRERFGTAWADTDSNGCPTREDILKRDLTRVRFQDGHCKVASGELAKDPYTGQRVEFRRGSSLVDIDHVVALSDAWQKGAQQWPAGKRIALANDPLNLIAVGASANRQKSDGDAATWLPAEKSYRCDYIAHQVAVKKKYGLWVTRAEKAAMEKVLRTCPAEKLPTGGNPTAAPPRFHAK